MACHLAGTKPLFAGILFIGLLGTNFSGILIKIYIFSLREMHLKLSSAKMAAILSRGDELKTRLAYCQLDPKD